MRTAARALVRHPGFSIPAVATLALGMGAATVVFSLAYGMLLTPLPYSNAPRLVLLWEFDRTARGDPGGDFGPITTVPPADFAEWRAETRTLESLEGLTFGFYPVLQGASPTEVVGGRVTPGFFTTVGVQPLVGRTFAPGDPDDVVVLGYKLWESQYGADRSIVGRRILLGNRNFTVLRVLPPRFFFYIREFALWMPLEVRPNDRTGPPLMAVGLLRAGKAVSEAQAEFGAIASRLEQAHPATNNNRGARVIALREQYSRFFRPTLTLLVGSVGFLILIACANVASLLLARTTERAKEMAVRRALGLLAAISSDNCLRRVPFSRLPPVFPAWPPLLFSCPRPGRSCRCICRFPYPASKISRSVYPFCSARLRYPSQPCCCSAWHRRPSSRATWNIRSASPGASQTRVLDGIVVAEVAVSVLLLTLAGVTGRTVFAMYHQLGFNTDHVLTFRTPVGRGVSSPELVRFFTDVLEHAKTVPNVSAVAAAYGTPGGGVGRQNAIFVKGGDEPKGRARAGTNLVSGEFFQVLDIPLTAGRTFSPPDGVESKPVAIVSASLARKLFPNADVIGRLVRIDGQPADRWLTVIGVVGDVRPMVSADPVPMIYQPYTQDPPGAIGFVVKTSGPPLAIAPTIERVVWTLRPGQPITYLGTLENDLDEQGFRERLSAIGLGWFAGCGLVLACAGLYGLIGYVVKQRVKEFGVRLAVGATAGDVISLVLRRGAALVAIGLLMGMTASALLTRVLQTFLYGIKPVDSLAFAGAATLLAVTGFAACYIPAIRAARTDPMEILRSE